MIQTHITGILHFVNQGSSMIVVEMVQSMKFITSSKIISNKIKAYTNTS